MKHMGWSAHLGTRECCLGTREGCVVSNLASSSQMHQGQVVTGSEQSSLTKGKSHLTPCLGFLKKMSGSMGQGRPREVIYHHFGRAVSSGSSNVFIDNPTKCRLEKWRA